MQATGNITDVNLYKEGGIMKIKKLSAVLTATAIALSFSACGTDEDTSTDGGVLAEGDTFTVGFDAEFPPFGFQEDGEYVGFDLDLAQEVAKRNGWEYEATPIAWDSKDMELDSGNIDVIWNGFTITPERESEYSWSKPYVDNKIVFVVRADAGIETAADLAGKVVEVQADSSGLAALQNPDNADLVSTFGSQNEVPDYNTGLMDLESGATDAVAMDSTVAGYQIKQRGEDKFEMIDPGFDPEQYGIGFKLGNDALRDQVQITLDEMIADGTFTTLAEKWGVEDSVVK